MKHRENAVVASGRAFLKSLLDFGSFFFFYLKRKIVAFSRSFERNKNVLVKFFLMKRGRYNRPFLHITTMGVLGIGVLLAPFLADTYPIFSSNASTLLDLEKPGAAQQSIAVGENVFQTEISEKPRDKIIEYAVQKGDTLSTIAQKFNVSAETIRWSNNMTNDNLSIGDTLQILPVSGIAHKVSEGDTVYTIAKKYDTEAQKIVDFPFNEFANPETFSLIAGQMLIVPDGVKPSEPRPVQRRVYIASGPTTLSPGGFTWPLRGGISQFASWYHMALDITADYGTPVVAAQNGQVTKVNIGTWDGGYGTNVYVENADGFQTHYAHLSSVNVAAGQSVTAGRTVVGWVGLTGRTTGPHLHFEIIKSGVLVNPLSYLQ